MEMVERNEPLEWATVFDISYGTPRAPVEAALSAGQDVMFDIDWQGTQQLREKARADVVSAFILPPSMADLEKRLHSSAQYSADAIRNRMSPADRVMSHWAEYDYIVINQDIEAAFAELQSILKAERLKRERRLGLRHHIRALATGVAFQSAATARTGKTQSRESAFELLQARIALLEAALASRPPER
jgi:guanylate kinase